MVHLGATLPLITLPRLCLLLQLALFSGMPRSLFKPALIAAWLRFLVSFLAVTATGTSAAAQRPEASGASDSVTRGDSLRYRYTATARLDSLKAEASREVDSRAKQIQEMVDQVFSYGAVSYTHLTLPTIYSV